MSKLSIVVNALTENSAVKIIKQLERIDLPGKTRFEDRSFSFSHEVFFYVAPCAELGEEKNLQEQMMSLVPNLEPSFTTDFRYHCEDGYGWGDLVFNEHVGSEVIQRTLTLTETDVPTINDGEAVWDIACRARFTEKVLKLEVVNELKRRIHVYFYSHSESAKIAAENHESSQLRH